MLPLACTNAEKFTVTCTPDGEIDGALSLSVIEGDGSFSQDPSTPLVFEIISGTAAGLTRVRVAGDKIVGSGVEELEDFVELTVSVPQATSLGLSASAAQPK